MEASFGSLFISLWGECVEPRPVLGSLAVPFLSALPALCFLCSVFLTGGRNWRYQNILQLTLLVSCYNGTVELGFQPWALEGARNAAHSFCQSPGFQTLALCVSLEHSAGRVWHCSSLWLCHLVVTTYPSGPRGPWDFILFIIFWDRFSLLQPWLTWNSECRPCLSRSSCLSECWA